MPSHTETVILPYTPQQLFALVADIESYPEFLPWCRAARVHQRHADHLVAELVISFKHITEQYTSRVELTPHSKIEVSQTKGPFAMLHNLWEFTPEGGGTRIDFLLEFQFRSALLEKLIGYLFGNATDRMVAAFTERAHALYG